MYSLLPPLAYLLSLLSCLLFAYTVTSPSIPRCHPLRVAVVFLIILSCAATAYTARFCSGLRGWNAFVGTTFGIGFVFETLDVLVLQPCCRGVVLFPFDDRDRDRDRDGSPKGKSPASRWRRLQAGLDLALNKRKIGTTLQVRNLPSFSRTDPSWIPSRTQFLVFRTVRVVLTYLLIELLTGLEPAAAPDISGKVAPGQEWILWRIVSGLMTPLEAGEVVGLTLVFWFLMYLVQMLGYDAFSIVAVGVLGVDGPRDWPPRFGALGETWSVRRFWGVFWHQDLRHSLTTISEFIVHDVLRLPRGSSSTTSATTLLTRYAKIHLVFLLSALVHLSTDSFMGVPPAESGAVTFYCTHAAGILFEDAVAALYRAWTGPGTGRGSRASSSSSSSKVNSPEPKARWIRAVGYLWTLAFLSWSTPAWAYPQMRVEMQFPLPVRVLTRRW
ncbi:hypothetical protein VTN02DRAFT_53 [Thermoascus thermophilus]